MVLLASSDPGDAAQSGSAEWLIVRATERASRLLQGIWSAKEGQLQEVRGQSSVLALVDSEIRRRDHEAVALHPELPWQQELHARRAAIWDSGTSLRDSRR